MTEKKTIRALEEAYRAVFQHLLVHKRKPSTFEEYRIAYARLCDFYIRHRVSSYDPVVSEMFRRYILRQHENGMLSLNYRRLCIRLSVYVDNYFAGRILTARNADSRIAERYCKLSLMDYEPSAHYRQMLDDYSRYLSLSMSEAKAGYRAGKAKLLLCYMEENGKAGLKDLSVADLERKTVSFRQKKTGVRVTLPITDQAAAATADYIRSGRPETASTTLFVSHRYPYGAIPHISSVFYPIMQKAGIDKTKGDKKGFHSFRRMLGGLLLESGTDFPLISQIPGHSDTSTVARYMPFGMEALEICVMDLPSMGGGKEAGS